MTTTYLHVLTRLCEEVQQNMANKLGQNGDEIHWDVSVEIVLFYAMMGRKPVGVNRNFMMLPIHEKFSSYINRQMHSKVIWDHLESLYDMAALHESEILPFPNEEVDFELPPEFDEIAMARLGVALPHTDASGSNRSKNNPVGNKTSKKVNTPKLKPSVVSNAKNSFATPVNPSKSGKNSIGTKTEPKAQVSEIATKIKQEISIAAKMNKVKRSSSPFSNKCIKSEPQTRENSPDIPVTKKTIKFERGSSPAVTKKTKVETSNASASGKKTIKESTNSVSKQSKSESADNKKGKNDRESAKKGKSPAATSETNKKGGKAENTNGARKSKSDVDNNTKKSNGASSKPKTDAKNNTSKGNKTEDTEPGPRKSISLVRSESSDSLSKRKRKKPEETTKKQAPPAKRRRN